MRQVDSLFLPTADRVLYHYTGIRGLLGIVDSRAIWASHVYYLNDSKEILHACDVLGTLLMQREGVVEPDEREFVKQFREWLETFRRTPYHLFVFSLSEERSLLSQWRSYTPHGKGVSLGFSPAVLNHVLRRPEFRIAKCLYARHEQEALMGSLLEKTLTTFRQRLPDLDAPKAHPSQKYHPFLEEFRKDILQVLAIVKHEAFSEEREWRIVSPYFPKYTVPDVKFREGASMLLPYTELELPRDGYLFHEVVLGPSQDANLSMSALATYLSNRGVCNTTVNSMVPLRDWQAS
jgi:Protein of unknown function (DUF2971)